MHFLLYFFYLTLFLLIIYHHRFFAIEGAQKNNLTFFFLLKVLAGISLTLIYTCYYTDQTKADIYRYFRDSKIISSILFSHPLAWLKIMSGIGINDSDTFKYITDTLYISHPHRDPITDNSFLIRLISLLNYFSLYNIYIDTLFINFITFIGLIALFKTLRIYFAAFQWLLYIPLFLLPSFIFWTSGLLKESILVFGICLYISAWLKSNESRTVTNTLLLLFAFAIVAATKMYVALILAFCTPMLPFSSGLIVSEVEPSHKGGNGIVKAFAMRILFYVFTGILCWHFIGNTLCEYVIDKHNEFIRLESEESAGSAINNTIVQGGDKVSLLVITPTALANAVLSPLPWHKGPIFQTICAYENAVLLLSMVFMFLLFFKMPDRKKLFLILFCFSFALLNYLIIGLTVPVMGAIVHYRVISQQFLLLGVLLLVDLEQ